PTGDLLRHELRAPHVPASESDTVAAESQGPDHAVAVEPVAVAQFAPRKPGPAVQVGRPPGESPHGPARGQNRGPPLHPRGERRARGAGRGQTRHTSRAATPFTTIARAAGAARNRSSTNGSNVQR